MATTIPTLPLFKIMRKLPHSRSETNIRALQNDRALKSQIKYSQFVPIKTITLILIMENVEVMR